MQLVLRVRVERHGGLIHNHEQCRTVPRRLAQEVRGVWSGPAPLAPMGSETWAGTSPTLTTDTRGSDFGIAVEQGWARHDSIDSEDGNFINDSRPRSRRVHPKQQLSQSCLTRAILTSHSDN